jgi:hypothetical protein
MDGFNICIDCGICYTITNIKHKNLQFKSCTNSERYEWSTAWEKLNDKTTGDDKFFHIVPNEHIKTYTHLNQGLNSFHDILSSSESDINFKNMMLFYIDTMINDAISFALNKLQIANVRRVVSSTTRYFNILQSTKGDLFIAIHFDQNSKSHMHLHCDVNGNNDFFNKSIKFTDSKKSFGPRNDLFFESLSSISMSIDYFRNIIATA